MLPFLWYHPAFSEGSPPPASSAIAAITTMCRVNRVPLERVHVIVQRPTGHLGASARAMPEVARVRGYTGGLYAGAPTLQDFTLTIEGVMLVAPLMSQPAYANAVTDLFVGEVEIEWAHAPGWIMRGVAGPITVEPMRTDRAFVADVGGDAAGKVPLRVLLQVRCADAAVWATEPRRLALSTTPAPIDTGSLPVGGEILINGPHSGALDIDIIGPSGALQQRLALRDVQDLPVSLAVGDVLTIRRDAPRGLLRTTALGVVTDVYAWRSLTYSTPWRAIPPQDALTGARCYARLSAGTGVFIYAVPSAH